MPDLYPLPLDIVPTRNWRDAVTCLSSDGGVMFSSNLLAASSRDLRAVASPWRNCDSHWSEFGCLLTANELLRRLGLNDIQSESEEVSPTPLFGDFSQKFGGPALYEMVSRRVKHELPAPIKIFDSGDSRPYTGSVGRRIIWENLAVPIKLHLLIIGNSFSGSGDDSTHLTYWMSRVFMKVTFLHSGQIPTDVLDFYRPDLILFQGLERFMGSVPSDDLKAEVIESVFVGEKQD